MKKSAEWKEYSKEIQHTVNKSSIQWMLILVIFFHAIVTLYLNIESQPLSSAAMFAFIVIGLSIIISCIYLRTNKYRFINFYLSSVMLTIAWLGIAFIIHDQWGEAGSAVDVLIIAFICSLLANYSNISLLLLSSIAFATAFALLQLQMQLTTFDLFISFSKFPVLLFLFMLTIRKLLTKGQYHVIKNEMLKRQLQRLSIIDDLTQIQNRKGFRLALASLLASAKRFNLGFTLLILDVDYFKQYNDSFGHPEGDKCLVNIAKILTDSFQRETDIVARLGGEEFAILVPDVDLYTANKICQRIHQSIADAAIIHPNSSVAKTLTVSIGGVIFKSEDNETSIYARADKALYQAKSKGRNGSVILSNESQLNVKNSNVN
ncbi:GGDEF domain-containing protein [Cognaticolwellia mytili]|uniref:GGDEF domain-containing protein n=1 Tax=Cognaticolwellia mytili TaxID=1888913 RepID=UPI000A16D5AC|nr:GGDEF domain-containing protein [Cognaticolwellia mytili]